MGMRMRAGHDIEMGQDMFRHYINPLAAALHDPMLRSRCSACFRSLNINNSVSSSFFSCNSDSNSNCRCSVSYCSQDCSNTDLHCHRSSGECSLLYILCNSATFGFSNHWPNNGNTSDLRAALRLLHRFAESELNFDLNSHCQGGVSLSRIGGLLSNRDKLVICSPEQQFSEDDVDFGIVSQRIKEGGRIMALARKMAGGGCFPGEENLLEETVLCQVITNGVEVQVDDQQQQHCLLSLGTAVYGPLFSWCNHSCTPNVCYKFCLMTTTNCNCSWGGGGDAKAGAVPVPPGYCYCSGMVPHGQDNVAITTVRHWVSVPRLGSPRGYYGPGVVLRTIRPVPKDAEICIAYTDPLQPKVKRHLELWLKYRFVCCCDRCSFSPSTYADRILQEPAANLYATSSGLEHNFSEDEKYWELSNYIEQVTTDYMNNGNPEACCEKLEKLLAENCQANQSRFGELTALPPSFELHPLHHLSLDAYTILASAYRVRASCISLDPMLKFNQLEAFRFSRVAAAYSLLLAGATHHLLLSEPSLIITVSRFWINVGESLLNLVRSSRSACPTLTPSIGDCLLIKQSIYLDPCRGSREHIEGSESWAKFSMISKGFHDCVMEISSQVWSFLNHGSHYLEAIKNPVEFSWLGKACQPEETWVVHGSDHFLEEGLCGCSFEPERCIEEEEMCLFQFAAHCLIYGGYLTSICYGSQYPLVGYVGNLLFGKGNCSVSE